MVAAPVASSVMLPQGVTPPQSWPAAYSFTDPGTGAPLLKTVTESVIGWPKTAADPEGGFTVWTVTVGWTWAASRALDSRQTAIAEIVNRNQGFGLNGKQSSTPGSSPGLFASRQLYTENPGFSH